MRMGMCLLVAITLTACHPGGGEADQGAEQQPVAAVKVQTAMRRPIVDTLDAPANVVPLAERTGSLMPTVPARVMALHVALGQRVKSGQLIAQLIPDPTTRADYEKARAAYGLAQRDLDRQRRLFDGGVVPRATLEQAQATFEQAQADLDARQAAYRLAEANTSLRAPITGVVTEMAGAVGQVADTTTPLAMIADLSVVGLDTEVPNTEVNKLHPGDAVTVVTPDKTRLPGHLRTIPDLVDPATQRARVLVEADNPKGLLRPGSFATVAFTLGQHAGILLPESAVVPREAGSVVYTVSDGHAHEHAVTSRPAGGGQVEILTGLKGGETVAVEGTYVLSDGAPVRVGS
jgi:cobalt-zinc-cadmium efflux system membrane fusion protein